MDKYHFRIQTFTPHGTSSPHLMSEEREKLLCLTVIDQIRHFSGQWEAHRKDLTEGRWTNMTFVGVSSDGTSSSVKVTLQLQEWKKSF